MLQNLDRKLAVILHADIVGSTQLVQENEALAHQGIIDVLNRLAATVGAHDGEVQEIRGDALLAVFQRASDAVAAALEFQGEQAKTEPVNDDNVRARLRVGIAMGEVIVADGTVTGAGVVLAQRLEQKARAGEVIIQAAVRETLPVHLPILFDSLGEQKLKGFSESVRAFRAKSASVNVDEWARRDRVATPAMPEKPSIAVLPFINHSGDPEQEYFSDGITEDIIAELSRFHSLFVIARNSSFRYKRSDVSIQDIGRSLGVHYVVEGSVRRAGERIRIVVQLSEAETEKQIWAERYDRELQDIFELQDEVTRSIVAILPGRIQEDVVDRAARKPTDNMKAYELMLQGKAYRDMLNAEGNAGARACCEMAIELDPRYARAYMYLSDSYIVDLWLGLADDNAQERAMTNARKAADLDSNDVYIQDHLGFAHLSCGLWREAEVQFDRALGKIVNEAESMAWCGYAFLLLGQTEKARGVVVEARRMDPLHPPTLDWILGQISFYEEDYEQVIDLLYGKALLNSLAYAFVAASHAFLNHHESTPLALSAFVAERRKEFTSRGINVTDDSVNSLAGAYRRMWKNPVNWEMLADGLRRAGLPD